MTVRLLLLALLATGCDPDYSYELPVTPCETCPTVSQVEIRRTCTATHEEVDGEWEVLAVADAGEPIESVTVPSLGCFHLRFTDTASGVWALRGVYVEDIGVAAPNVLALQDYRWMVPVE